MTDYQAHPSAVIDEPATIGDGTRIWHFCHVMTGAEIGRNCVLGQNVFVASGVTIGDGVKIQNNVSIYQGCVIEDDAFLGPSCVFTNVSTPRSAVDRKDAFETTRVGRGATVGANATIVCGVTIGAYAFVAAGAVVTRDVGPHELVMGVPARPVGHVCSCGVRLPDAALGGRVTCERCGKDYKDPAD